MSLPKLRITYRAEGWRNGCRMTLADLNGGRTFEDVIIDNERWYGLHTDAERENLLLSLTRMKYPEVDWYLTRCFEIHHA